MPNMCLDLCWMLKRYENVQHWYLLSRSSLEVKERLICLRHADVKLWHMTIRTFENSRTSLKAKVVQEGIMEEGRHICIYFMLHSCQCFVFLHIEVFTCIHGPDPISMLFREGWCIWWSYQTSCFLLFSLLPNRICFSLVHVYWVPCGYQVQSQGLGIKI